MHRLPAILAAAPLTAATATAARHALADTNLITNPSFGTGALSPWSCSPLDTVTSSPVHSGTEALLGAANNSDNAQCAQAVNAAPSSTYTLTAFAQGNYVSIGDTGTSTSGTGNWAPGATSWRQLPTRFSAGVPMASVTIYVHGWYGHDTYFADDSSLTGLAVTGTTSSQISLTGVQTGTHHGLYQAATGPSAQFGISQRAAAADREELVAAGLTSNPFVDSATQAAWIHDGNHFCTCATPQSIAASGAYVKQQGLAGELAFSLDADDQNTTLLNAMTSGLP